MININFLTLGIHLVFFLVMVVVLNQLLFKPLLSVIDARKDSVDSNQHAAEASSKKADAIVADYNEKMEQVRKDASVERDKVRREAEAEEDRIIKAARDKAGDQVAGIRESIAAEYDKASATLKAETEAMGKDIAGRLLGRAV